MRQRISQSVKCLRRSLFFNCLSDKHKSKLSAEKKKNILTVMDVKSVEKCLRKNESVQ